MFDHIGIRVSDQAASERFYDTVLSVLGLPRLDGDDYTEWGDFAIGTDGPTTRNLHVGFYAPTHELVDAFHRAGVEAGYASDGEPGPRPQYTPEYYGAFLLDPDGNSIEAVHLADEDEPGQIDHLWLRTTDVAAVTAFYATIAPVVGPRDPDPLRRPRAARRRRPLVLVRDRRADHRERPHRLHRAGQRHRRAPSTRPPSTPATATTAGLANGRNTTPATTGRSCSIPTATTSRPSTTTAEQRAAGGDLLVVDEMVHAREDVELHGRAERASAPPPSRAPARAGPSRRGRSCRDTPASPRRSPSAAAPCPAAR